MSGMVKSMGGPNGLLSNLTRGGAAGGGLGGPGDGGKMPDLSQLMGRLGQGGMPDMSQMMRNAGGISGMSNMMQQMFGGMNRSPPM